FKSPLSTSMGCISLSRADTRLPLISLNAKYSGSQSGRFFSYLFHNHSCCSSVIICWQFVDYRKLCPVDVTAPPLQPVHSRLINQILLCLCPCASSSTSTRCDAIVFTVRPT